MTGPSPSPASRRRKRQRIRIVAELLIGGAAIWFVTHPARFPTPPEPEALADSLPATMPDRAPDSGRVTATRVPAIDAAARDTVRSTRLVAPSLRLPRSTLPARLLPTGRLFRSVEERARAGERIAVTMTAYCLQGRTRRGNLVRDGIIAVDRAVFPLGRDVDLFFGRSKYGRFLADDTGRDIVGGRIDVWIEDCRAARRFGRRRGYAQLVPREPSGTP